MPFCWFCHEAAHFQVSQKMHFVFFLEMRKNSDSIEISSFVVFFQLRRLLCTKTSMKIAVKKLFSKKKKKKKEDFFFSP